MAKVARALRRKDITGLARETWSRIWGDAMPPGWRVHLVRKTVIQRPFGREVCGVTLRHTRTILIGRHTGWPNFRTLVHELAHLRTIDETSDHGPRWRHEFYDVARPACGSELEKNI